jgi:glutamine cyclotransferase
MKLLAKTTCLLFLLFSLVLLNCSCSDSKKPAEIEHYTFEVVNSYPHDPTSFTQGLVFEKGLLYESTGRYGLSSILKVDLKAGNVLKAHNLDDKFFGEGITVYQDRIIQITWREHVGFVYNKSTFKLLGTFSYQIEGWGITHDGKSLIMSDGTSWLDFLDPESFEKTGSLHVHDDKGPVGGINELEYIRGQVYANIFPTNKIAKIDPRTGRVTAWIDLEGLYEDINDLYHRKVLNGIAYDKENDRLFVTGKLWPKLFEIKLIKK